MQLQTNITLRPQQHNQIDYNSKIVLFGSCFTENIGNKLNYFKFQNFVNPFGILFHPKAIENLILNSINEKVYTDNDVFFHNERWHCFDTHSALSTTSKEEILTSLNNAITQTHKQLYESTHIIITLGTAWIYRLIETDRVVANCHKIPQKKFLKELVSVDDLAESLASIVALIKSVNTKAPILFTVSPVRHIKDGFVENMRSKSHLITSLHRIIEPRNNVHYFPSYELMMDELRDYRFYKEDMLHPNQTAINYIWEQFCKVWVSDASQKTMQKVEAIRKGLSHNPFNSNSAGHQKFLDNLKSKIAQLQEEFPTINFS